MLRATVGSETYFRRQQALPFAPNLWGLPPVRDASALGEVRVISRSQPLCPSLDAGIRAAAPVFHLALARGRSPRSFGLIGPSCGGSCAQRTTLPRRRRLRGQRVFNRPCVSRLLSAASAWLHACLSACLLPPPPGFFSFLLLSPHASVGACSTCVCVYAGQLNRRERERAICAWHARLCRGGLWTRRCAWANSKRIEAGFLPALLAVEVGKLIWFRYGAELETHA